MADAKGLKIDTMRSYLGRARGLGAGNAGFHLWWMQRLTSLALLPLTLWFVWSLAHLAGAPYEAARAWAGGLVHAALLLALIAAAFTHMHLGVQVVAEDYIHTAWIQKTVILGVKAASAMLALAATIAVLRLAIGK
jgi:succinate dehydrogenase / fumarate reductase membrane anchor subunit